MHNAQWTIDLLNAARKVYPIDPDRFFNHNISMNDEGLIVFTIWTGEFFQPVIFTEVEFSTVAEDLINAVKESIDKRTEELNKETKE